MRITDKQIDFLTTVGDLRILSIPDAKALFKGEKVRTIYLDGSGKYTLC